MYIYTHTYICGESERGSVYVFIYIYIRVYTQTKKSCVRICAYTEVTDGSNSEMTSALVPYKRDPHTF